MRVRWVADQPIHPGGVLDYVVCSTITTKKRLGRYNGRSQLQITKCALLVQEPFRSAPTVLRTNYLVGDIFCSTEEPCSEKKLPRTEYRTSRKKSDVRSTYLFWRSEKGVQL